MKLQTVLSLFECKQCAYVILETLNASESAAQRSVTKRVEYICTGSRGKRLTVNTTLAVVGQMARESGWAGMAGGPTLGTGISRERASLVPVIGTREAFGRHIGSCGYLSGNIYRSFNICTLQTHTRS
jgi:hypothetical protein